MTASKDARAPALASPAVRPRTGLWPEEQDSNGSARLSDENRRD
jgi:hypothetical protein